MVTTDCHWHYDGNNYWAHCYPTDGPYSFRMHIVCNFGPATYDRTTNWAQSPNQIYSDGINCFGGGAALNEWVDTSG